VSYAKPAEPTEVPFGMLSEVDPGNHMLDGVHICHPPLANTIEPSVCGGDAALYKITLTTCLLWLLCAEAA